MKKRFVYVVRSSTLNPTSNRFDAFSTDNVLTSCKLAVGWIMRGHAVNKGSGIAIYIMPHCFEGRQVWHYDYECLSTDGKPMKLRYLIEQKELNRYY